MPQSSLISAPLHLLPSALLTKSEGFSFKQFLKKYELSDTITRLRIRYRLHFPPISSSRVSVFETLGSNQQWGLLQEEPKFSNWFQKPANKAPSTRASPCGSMNLDRGGFLIRKNFQTLTGARSRVLLCCRRRDPARIRPPHQPTCLGLAKVL